MHDHFTRRPPWLAMFVLFTSACGGSGKDRNVAEAAPEVPARTAGAGRGLQAPGSPLALSPQYAVVPAGGGIVLTASGGSGSGYLFSTASSPSGGGCNTSGIFIAGSTSGVTDVVQVTDSAGNLARVRIHVEPAAAGPKVSPSGAVLVSGDALGFAVMANTGTPPFAWSFSTHYSSGSSIDNTSGPSTRYTAGAPSDASDTLRLTDGAAAIRYAGIRVITAPLVVSPTSAALAPRAGRSFSAAGGSGLGYQWTLDPNRSGGTVSNTGAYAAGPTGGVIDVVQVSDSLGIVATAQVSVGNGVTVAPTSASVPPGESQTFTGSGGSGTGYTWSLVTNASGGHIGSTSGVYTAGPTGGVIDVVQVIDSLGNTQRANVAVTSGLAITPYDASLAPGGNLDFTATGGSGSGYTWSLATNGSGGGIDAVSGAYTAGATGGVTDVVRVTDSLGNAASANVTVTASLAIAPANVQVPPRATQSFTATGGMVGQGYTWSLLTNASGGSIDAGTGTYVAGPTGGVTDVVQVADASGNTASVEITVTAGISIAPGEISVVTGAVVTFVASGGAGSYVWSLDVNGSGATIDATSGTYRAGPTADQRDAVRVTDALGNTSAITVRVSKAPQSLGCSSGPAGAWLALSVLGALSLRSRRRARRLSRTAQPRTRTAGLT